MTWCRQGDKPLSEPMIVWLPTHICVTRPQWVNWYSFIVSWTSRDSLQGDLNEITTTSYTKMYFKMFTEWCYFIISVFNTLTCAPRRNKASLMARPKPRTPPVTRQILSFRSIIHTGFTSNNWQCQCRPHLSIPTPWFSHWYIKARQMATDL